MSRSNRRAYIKRKTEYIPCLYTGYQFVPLLVDTNKEALASKDGVLDVIREVREFYPDDQRFFVKRVVTEYTEVL